MSSIASPTWTWDIFLCYRRTQKDLAGRFKDKLEQFGLSVFMDIEPEATSVSNVIHEQDHTNRTIFSTPHQYDFFLHLFLFFLLHPSPFYTSRLGSLLVVLNSNQN